MGTSAWSKSAAAQNQNGILPVPRSPHCAHTCNSRNGTIPTTMAQTSTRDFRRVSRDGAAMLFDISEAKPKAGAARIYPQPMRSSAVSPARASRLTIGAELPATNAHIPAGMTTMLATAKPIFFHQGMRRSIGEGSGKTAKK